MAKEKRIIYKNDEGGVSIIIPAPGQDINAVAKKDVPAGKSFEIVDASAVPTDRSFRDAWTFEKKSFGHDMEKAKEIHKNRIREARAPKLAALDVDYQRADETADASSKKAIAAQKAKLRDLPASDAIKNAKTVEDLKAFWPDELK